MNEQAVDLAAVKQVQQKMWSEGGERGMRVPSEYLQVIATRA